jgi:hypothetical protein
MAFWANPGTEPKRIYRWVMRFNINNKNNIDEWLVKSVSRPTWNLSETPHSFINHTFYYPGRIEYDEISVQLVDAITPNAAVNMQNLLALSGYVTPDNVQLGQPDGYQTISKAGWGAEGAGLGAVEIVQMDPEGASIETWKLYNTWIKSCNLNELNYESDDLLNIDLTLRYDYFKVESGPGLSRRDIENTFKA